MGRPAFTEAELRRAAKVAGEMGRDLVIERGRIRIVAAAPAEPLPSSDDGEDAWDAAFREASG